MGYILLADAHGISGAALLHLVKVHHRFNAGTSLMDIFEYSVIFCLCWTECNSGFKIRAGSTVY